MKVSDGGDGGGGLLLPPPPRLVLRHALAVLLGAAIRDGGRNLEAAVAARSMSAGSSRYAAATAASPGLRSAPLMAAARCRSARRSVGI